MSSNNNHINITRDNYEEYFLLYTDNELSVQERAVVEAFALIHPDLQEELELLQGTKLTGDNIVFDSKDVLLADAIQQQSVGESLLLYIDNELGENEKNLLTKQLRSNPALHKEYQDLLLTKLDPAENYIYPDKQELFRKEEKRYGFGWMKIAAAVILMLGIAALLFLKDRSKEPLPVAIKDPAPVIKTTNGKITEDQQVNQVALEDPKPAIEKILPSAPHKTEQKLIKNDQPLPLEDRQVAIVENKTQDKQDAAVETLTATTNRTAEISSDFQQHNINSNTVTIATSDPYKLVADISTTAPSDVDNSNGKQGSVRGLLRKATRFIERRTGINPVNEDDKLYVGALAISLK